MCEVSSGRVVQRGTRGSFHWMTVSGDVYMEDLLRSLPEAVLHRYLAVTSYDSGVRRLEPDDTDSGWRLSGRVAYSPLIRAVESLKYQRDGPGSPGYDEWYVFREPRNIGAVFDGNYFDYQPADGSILVYVNSPAFALHEAEPYLPRILEHFWRQMERLRPETFIADGRDHLTLVSVDSALIARAAGALA